MQRDHEERARDDRLVLPLLMLFGAVLYLLLMNLYLTLPAGQARDSNDLKLYHAVAGAMLRGEIPYRDFFIEYPPGSLLAFLPPALFAADRAAYSLYFASEMALVLVAGMILTALSTRRPSQAVESALVFALGALILYPVSTARYDPVVALTLAAAAACAARGRSLPAFAALGFGAAAKIVPALAVFPLAALGGVRRLRHAGLGFGVFLLVVALFLVPAGLLGGQGLAASFGYQAERGLQLESLASSVLLALGAVRRVGFSYGAFEVHGGWVDLAVSLSFPLTAALLSVCLLLLWRRHGPGGMPPALFPRYAAAFILAFMLGSKVLSPQYMIWLLPLVPLGAEGAFGVFLSAVFLTACYLTTQIYPFHYHQLVVGHEPEVMLLLARNALLVILWVALLLAPTGKRVG